MVKTTVYLPEDLKASLARLADAEGRSEAELIRDAIEARVAASARPRPRIPLISGPLGDATASERVDELLTRFGRE